MNIAVIPARGGSKRIPRKNIKSFNGKPMIAWSIEAVKRSKIFDKILVSTDDKEIAKVSQDFGAEVPFLRPAELSDDFVGTNDVIAHAIKWLIDNNWSVTLACCVYATSPFLNFIDLQESYKIIKTDKWSYVFSASEYSNNVYRSFSLEKGGGVEMLFPEKFFSRSQDLPISLHDAGQFYWGSVEAWLTKKKFFEKHSFPFILPNWRVHDIDNLQDWKRAEMMVNFISEGDL